MFESKKAKIALFGGLGVAALALVAGALLFGGKSTPSSQTGGKDSLSYQVVQEGSITSSTLIAGTLTAGEEQYVYYDASKGNLTEIHVKQGDQVQVGQALVQYDVAELQANYDTAVRARDKIARQIDDLKANGKTVQMTGDEAIDSASVDDTQRSVDMQLKDLNDGYADAQSAVDKATTALNEATIKSTVSGTVVEVNRAVSKTNTSTNQTVVHIVNQGSLQVTGSLSEYDLANIAVDQEVKITSKVYPDKVWTGKISYVSNYPEESQAGVKGQGSGTGSSSKYPFKASLTSEVGPLKQGFNVNVEIVNNSKHVLVPVSAVMTEKDQSFVWIYKEGTVQKVSVQLGSSDAKSQEVIEGLKVGDKVISNPNDSLKDGEKVSANEEKAN